MHLETTIQVRHEPEEISNCDHSNVPMRDRGVGSVRHNPETALGVGFEFSTFGTVGTSDLDKERGKCRIGSPQPTR